MTDTPTSPEHMPDAAPARAPTATLPSDRPRLPFSAWGDTTLLLAGAAGVLYIAGSEYQQAYYQRFAIDPGVISTSSFTLALDGVNAMLSTTASLLAWIPLVMICLMLLAIGADWLDKRLSPADGAPRNATTLVMTLAWSLLGATAIVLVLNSGDAGASGAGARFRNVREGKVWDYHLDSETISGIAIGQNPGATWILTKVGIRQVKTEAIRRIDGPMLTLAAESVLPAKKP